MKARKITKIIRIISLKLLLFAFLFGMVALMTGCIGNQARKARKHVRKAKRHIERAKDLYPEVVTKDTLVIYDTVVIDRRDTVVIERFNRKDSVIVLNNERVKVMYRYNEHTDTIHHYITEKEIVKPIETRVEVERIKEPTNMDIIKSEWPNYLLILLVAIVLIIILRK